MCYIITEQSGTDQERAVFECSCFAEVDRCLNKYYDADELELLGVGVYKQLSDGTLTTDF
jgi:hypothetical protein